jgi:hypothetical protein
MRQRFIDNDEIVVCVNYDGRGGWSLHAPGTTDTDIAEGDAPALVSGQGRRIPRRAYRAAAEALCSWAAEIIPVTGGYMAFESVADARTWRRQT